MDVEKEIFNTIYLCDYPAFSLCQAPESATCLYLSEGNGQLIVFDERVGKVSTKWQLHRDCIGSVDFNPHNPNMLATSSLDSTICLWDLRNMKMLTPQSLKIVNHKSSVHSAYFSPSGSYLATTRFYFSLNIMWSPYVVCCKLCLDYFWLHVFVRCVTARVSINGHVAPSSLYVFFLW